MKLSHVPAFGLIAAFYCRTAVGAAFCPYSKSLRVRERKSNESLSFGKNRGVPGGPLAVLLLAAKEGEQSDSSEDGWESNDTSVPVPRATSAVKGGEENPDMFIPVFAIVAITGFVGLYGYETLRLYLKGELYVPF
jgi:hypothetical protein